MKKILKKILINNFKSIFYILQNSNSSYLEFEKITFKLKKNSHLGFKNTYLSSRLDQIITPYLLRRGEWDYFIIKFILKILKKKKLKYSFIDIGANIGLVTRQLCSKRPEIIRDFYCIEPEKINYDLLCENLKLTKGNKIYKFNCALTNKKSGKKKIYLNQSNFGDFSLNKNENKNFSFVNTVNANMFLKKIISKYKINNIIYKSDTQGSDEMILLNIDQKIINKIKIMIIEVSNFSYLNKNSIKFINLIKKFNIKEDENGRKITEDQINRKIKEKIEFNLLLAKI